jgi:hypothetical protein
MAQLILKRAQVGRLAAGINPAIPFLSLGPNPVRRLHDQRRKAGLSSLNFAWLGYGDRQRRSASSTLLIVRGPHR